jgi:hypothetical protein
LRTNFIFDSNRVVCGAAEKSNLKKKYFQNFFMYFELLKVAVPEYTLLSKEFF